MMPTRVYAIIVNYNGWRDTIECLESLLRSDYPDLRVIVCDNASTDGSVERIQAWAKGEKILRLGQDEKGSAQDDNPLRHLSSPPIAKPVPVTTATRQQLDTAKELYPVRLLLVACDRNMGFAGANNGALRYLQRFDAEALALLINNDTVMAPNALRAMVEVAQQTPNVAAVGATMLRYEDPERIETLAGARVSRVHAMVETVHAGRRRDEARPSQVALDYVSATCILVTPRTLARVGLLDERFFLYGEDCDWGLRMKEAGLALAYSPWAEIWHKGGATVVHKSPVHDYYDVRARLMLIRKHNPLMLPLALVHTGVRIVLPKMIRGEWARVAAAMRAQRDFFFHVSGQIPATY